jgi:hypothetical protein
MAKGWLMEDLERIVLEVLSDGAEQSLGELETRTMKALGRKLPEDLYPETLETLKARRLLSITGEKVKRSEPDFPERDLEAGIETFISSEQAVTHLRLERGSTIWQKTARGGRAGTGTWSRPDFTIATIRKRKYDPVRHLDLIALELKNVAGSSVVAVHEALAHTRFAHYAYLVCPRSHLNASVQRAVRESCSQHGIGLLSFDLSVGSGNSPAFSAFRFEVDPRRQAPEPELVDNYIDDRFDVESQERLSSIAGGQHDAGHDHRKS